MKAKPGAPRRAIALLLLAPVVLCAGTCGSVLRGHYPDGWPTTHEGPFLKKFGTLEIESGWLIRLEGSAIPLKLTNRGTAPLRIDGVDLQAGDLRLPWTGTCASIIPGGSVSIHPRWSAEIREKRCAVILRTDGGEIRIDLVE